MNRRPDSKGFTLIELMVALGMALAVTASAVAVMVLAIRTQQEGTARNELARDAQLVMDIISRDLAFLGAGVPRGFEANYRGELFHINEYTERATSADFAAHGNKQLRPAIRIGQPDYLAFIGDVPYPNAELNGIGSVGPLRYEFSPPYPEQDEVAVMSELSPCTPPGSAGGYTCNSTTASLIADVGGPNCGPGNLNAPTCPWGLNKWQRTGLPVALVFSGLDGSWYRREWDPTGQGITTSDNRLFVHLEHVYDEPRARLPRRVFQGASMGGGMVAQLDRIFYSVSAEGAPGSACSDWPCTFWRRQCWGWDTRNTDPQDANFPAVGGTVMRPNTTPADCGAPNGGTPWERVMDDIETLTFAYFGPDGAPLTTPLTAASSARTRSIEVRLTLRRRLPGNSSSAPFIRHHLTRRFWLENAGGLVTFPERTPESAGGCWNDPTYPNECNPQ